MDRRQGLELAHRLGPPNERLRPGMDFMSEMYHAYHTELNALVGRSALERPYGEQQLTIAEQFFRETLLRESLLTADLMEVNRTIMNVYLQRALLDPDPIRGSYEVITDCQKDPATRLTLDTHAWARGYTYSVLWNDTRRTTMEAGQMRTDLGKAHLVADYMRERGKVYADHDRLLLELSEDIVAVRRWNPSFCWLPPGEQHLLRTLDRTGYHMPQDLQGESPVSRTLAFQELTTEEQHFGLLLGLLDIAGAQGDRVQNGSRTLTEPVVSSFRALVEARTAATPPHLSKQEAALFRTNLYRQFRSDQMGLSLNQPLGPELVRLGCNLNCSDPEQAQFMVRVMEQSMHFQDQADLLELLGYTGFESGGHAWIMYLPALITRYKEKLEDKGEPAHIALDAGLTLAARTYAAAKEQIDLSPGVVIVAGDLVRAFEKDPRIPQTHTIKIDSISPTEAKARFVLAA